ncbi:hypothetical protein M513_09796 [Trichuris suis]|uniref:Uncharacterized protein n=1 Tax=Trichuris suis TaxID=68888 RepID=A0A085LWK3_9BILA|nr:hypothetical protein M513_09796 [Trichuris suis]
MEGGGNLKEPKMFRKGCMEDPSSDGGGVLMYSDLSVRMAFIQKVFMLLMLQLSVAAAFIALFTFRLIYIVTIIIMSCFEAPRRQVPCNYICMMLVTLSLSFMTGAIAAYYKTEVVLLAAITCCICCFIVAVFATQSKYFALDLQLIMGNRKYAMSAEDYVFASTCLFVDIVVLFQYILALLGEMEH